MGELRKDYILDQWVLITEKRGKRPHEFKQAKPVIKEGICYFCPGNEDKTPPEIGRIGNDKWLVRWFENKFPAVDQAGHPGTKTDNRFYTYGDAYGHHTIIVETRDHNKQLCDLTVPEIVRVFDAYQNRIDELNQKYGVAYVNVFKNHGPMAGTSIVHSHSQVITTDIIPSRILAEALACSKFTSCPYCDIIQREKDSERRCYENNSFVAFAPYASRYNFEIWIFPKQHARHLHETNLHDLADILKKVLTKLHELNVSYNYALHYAPKDHDLHFHIEVYPEIAVWGGFERGSNMIINAVPPEKAAQFYRGEND